MTRWRTLPSRAVKSKGNAVNSGAYKSNISGWRTIGDKKYYFRSLWEIQFATYLEWLRTKKQIRDWEYEPKTFNFPVGKYKTAPLAYRPDYRVTELDGSTKFIEVKGFLNNDSKKKLKRFHECFPEEGEITIIDKIWFASARKQGLHNLLKWELMPGVH